MIILRNLTYIHPDRSLLFDAVNLTVRRHEKMALVGNNGSGKTTLLKIIAGELQPAAGEVIAGGRLYYLPQVYGQFNHFTVAEAMGIAAKLNALEQILNGHVSETNMSAVGDDWTIAERCTAALAYWQLDGIGLNDKLDRLSGGQKTKVFLAGLMVHQPAIVLLDEPGNHLDAEGKKQLADFITNTNGTVLLVSHDRQLLNLVETVAEIDKGRIQLYGGNYDFYATQKEMEQQAQEDELKSLEKSLRKARDKQRETLERQQKLDARGKQKQEKAGVARIMMKTLRNNAEKSTSKIRSTHAGKIDGITQEIRQRRAELPDPSKIKFGLDDAEIHNGKLLFSATAVNFSYNDHPVWNKNIDLEIRSGERIAFTGPNGSGKTTLIKVILGELEPTAGTITRAYNHIIYIDQEYSLINNELTIYGQALQFNSSGLAEHEIKTRLTWFLFEKEDWYKPCAALSGGEKMRLMLCCLTLSSRPPDIIVLDEPTNNLDMQNIEIVTMAVNRYNGTLIVVSHDEYFLSRINITSSWK